MQIFQYTNIGDTPLNLRWPPLKQGESILSSEIKGDRTKSIEKWARQGVLKVEKLVPVKVALPPETLAPDPEDSQVVAFMAELDGGGIPQLSEQENSEDEKLPKKKRPKKTPVEEKA